MDLTGQAVEPIWLALLSYFRQMWDYFGLMLHLYLAPDERLGREAVDIFLIGTVPSFLLRSTSALLLLGVVPGFIAGLGLVAFSHCQTSRSHKRRMKVLSYEKPLQLLLLYTLKLFVNFLEYFFSFSS